MKDNHGTRGEKDLNAITVTVTILPVLKLVVKLVNVKRKERSGRGGCVMPLSRLKHISALFSQLVFS